MDGQPLQNPVGSADDRYVVHTDMSRVRCEGRPQHGSELGSGTGSVWPIDSSKSFATTSASQATLHEVILKVGKRCHPSWVKDPKGGSTPTQGLGEGSRPIGKHVGLKGGNAFHSRHAGGGARLVYVARSSRKDLPGTLRMMLTVQGGVYDRIGADQPVRVYEGDGLIRLLELLGDGHAQ